MRICQSHLLNIFVIKKFTEDGASGIRGNCARQRAAQDAEVVTDHAPILFLRLAEEIALFKAGRRKKSAMHSLAQVYEKLITNAEIKHFGVLLS